MTCIILVLVVASRAFVIYMLTAITNLLRIKVMNISTNTQHIMVFGGIMRGSVTMAIAYKQLKDGGSDNNNEGFASDYDSDLNPSHEV